MIERKCLVRQAKEGLGEILSFFDEFGMIRTRGRIKHGTLYIQQQHPILLSTKHDFV